MKVGFVGLGQMGRGMAANLLRGGHQVTVFNRSADKAQELAREGASVAAQVRDACTGDVVITMLANDTAVNDVVFAEHGVLAGLRPGAIHVSMSTISIALAERMTEAHAQAHQQFVSAPVFGRPDAAAAAKLVIVAGGPTETIKGLEPVFSVMGQATLLVSERPRDASLVKIGGNFMIASAMQAMGEAVALVRKAGVAPQTFIDVMTSTIFNAPIYRNYGALIASGRFSPAGFAAPLGYKDVGLALQASEALRVPMPLASLLHDRLLRLLAEGGESLDWSAIAVLSAADAGLPRADGGD
ncbi:MAG TPA: NAD(P)-dependent oxidoreductase [Povalibacter sp.]|nr:NAD(P)-dependent oxidoreductase [Povalibacter sp.]